MTSYRWEKSYPEQISWGAPLPAPRPLHAMLQHAAEQWPERTGLEFYGQAYSFRRLWDLSNRAAAGLARLGVRSGSGVAIHLPNMPVFVPAFFGALIAGGRVVNLSFLTSPTSLAFQLRDAEVGVLITADPALPGSALLNDIPGLRAVLVCTEDDLAGKEGASGSFAALLQESGVPLNHPVSVSGDVILLQYTGGSTGAPKAAMLSHANVCASVDIRNRSAGDAAGGNDKTLLVTPLSHVSGVSSVLLCSIALGMPMVMHRRFDPAAVLTDVAEKKITILSLVPSMYALLVDHPEFGKFDLSSLKRCTSTGGPLPARVARKFRELTGLTLLERYGCTECAPAVASQVALGEAKPGTVGLPEPNTIVEIRDPVDGVTVMPPGTPGEICVRGPQVMKGYWKRDEESERALRDGVLHTGDLGSMDEAGFLTLTGRLKEIIFCGGFNIFPKLIEEALNEHPAVAEAAVIGVPDTYLVEMPKAFVVLHASHKDTTAREIRRFIAAKLSKHEMPAAIEIWESLPKTAAGKISKRDILATHLQPTAD